MEKNENEWEEFLPSETRSVTTAPRVSLGKKGLLNFNKRFVKDIIKDNTHCSLFYNPKKDLIGLKFNKTQSGFEIRGKQTGKAFSCSIFMQKYDIEAGKFDPVEESTGVIALHRIK